MGLTPLGGDCSVLPSQVGNVSPELGLGGGVDGAALSAAESSGQLELRGPEPTSYGCRPRHRPWTPFAGTHERPAAAAIGSSAALGERPTDPVAKKKAHNHGLW